MKKILFIIGFLLCHAAYSQSISLTLVGTAGDETDNATYKTSWSVGEVVTATATVGSTMLTQGFQQVFSYLKLLDFEAQLINLQGQLTWVTTNEMNTQEFVIERSTDSTTWNEIGTVAAKNTPGTNNYSYTDQQLVNGTTYYYRLKMIDACGNYNYSAVRTIEVNGYATPLFVIAPNPATSYTVLLFNSNIGSAQVSVYDMHGRSVFSDVFSGSSYTLNTYNLASGVYTINIRAKDLNCSERLMICK